MPFLPVFPIRLLMLILPVAIAVVVLMAVTATGRGQKAFGRQGVAWFITGLMVVAAIGIGYGKAANASNSSEPAPEPGLQQGPGTAPNAAAAGYYERDDAGVLSDGTMAKLNARNQRLYENYGVVIGVVTCNYGRDDLYNYALKRAEDMGLKDRDFIVVLDISGDNYWLVQGSDLADDFTDGDCSDYAWTYMEDAFAGGDYGRAVLDLTEMLELWYGVYFG